ncbi:hypothetical protein JCM16303_000645 [Sporobolomyces ruberrimus]
MSSNNSDVLESIPDMDAAPSSDSRERSPSSLFFDTDNEHLAVSSSGKPCSDKKKKSASRRGSQKQEPEVLVLWDSSDDEGSSQLGRPRPTIKKLKETGKGTGKGKGKGVVGKSEGKKGKKKEEAQLSGGVRSNDGSAPSAKDPLRPERHSQTGPSKRRRILAPDSPDESSPKEDLAEAFAEFDALLLDHVPEPNRLSAASSSRPGPRFPGKGRKLA